MNPAEHDAIHHPAHYTAYPVQPIEITRHLGFCLGNAVKYALRAPFKGRGEDCDKATLYLQWDVEHPVNLSFEAYQTMLISILRLSDFLRSGEINAVRELQAEFLDDLKIYAANIFRKGEDLESALQAHRGMLHTINDLRQEMEKK